MAVEFGTVGVRFERGARQLVEAEEGDAEAVVLGPGLSHVAAPAVGVGDVPMVFGLLEDEGEVLADEELASVAFGQFAGSADDPDQFLGDAGHVSMGGVDSVDGLEERRRIGRFKEDGDDAVHRPVLGHVGGPFLLDPFAGQRTGADDERQEAAVAHACVECDDEVLSRLQVAFVEERGKTFAHERRLEFLHPRFVGRGMGEEQVVAATLFCRHPTFPTAWVVSSGPV